MKNDPARFMRIHRSAIVNLDRVREVRGNGEPAVLLADGTRLKLSRTKRDQLTEALNQG